MASQPSEPQLSETFEGHHECISAFVVLPDARRMVTSSRVHDTLYLWELTTKRLLKRLVGHPSDVFEVVVSRDGRLIASCDVTGGIIPWDGETGDCLLHAKTTEITTQNGSTAQIYSSAFPIIVAYESTAVLSLDFSADGTTLASAGDRTVKFWNTTTWQQQAAITPSPDALAVVCCVRYSSSGEYLAIATEQLQVENIFIYNPENMQLIKTLNGHSGGTFTLTWTFQGTHLLSGGSRDDPTIRVWDASRGNEICSFRGHAEQINAISVNESNTIITSTSRDRSVRLWPFPIQSNVLKLSDGAFCDTFSVDGQYVFSVGDDHWQKTSQWLLPSRPVLTPVDNVIRKINIANTMSKAELNACITGNLSDLSKAVKIFTEAITVDASVYTCYVHRAIVFVRLREWDAALEDADKSVNIQRSALGLMLKGIALYGKKQMKEASRAFDRALQLASRDSTSHLLFLIKAIALFNANEHDEAIMHVKDMAEASLNNDADLRACNVVQTYFYAEMALAGSEGNIHDKAIEYITTAIKIATACSLETMDISVYTEFDVLFGWMLKSLWQKINKYRCLILFRASNIGALECYRLLMESCDKDERDSLVAWFATYMGADCFPHAVQTQSATEARVREDAEDEVKKARSETKFAETNTERDTEVDSATVADDKKQAAIKKWAASFRRTLNVPKDMVGSRIRLFLFCFLFLFLFSFVSYFFGMYFSPLGDMLTSYVGAFGERRTQEEAKPQEYFGRDNGICVY
ncbi:WD40-repeat-containing domain protein [Suillus bovinus]|uniref:WD40-repeat-containing domain protein n=1 Tax=Suillus bovinus TaxID=48563 RepID=UPI001B8632A9|nr:WD40-repeat-containing domain protein [Suillus bovinus]KAG2155339.1 WD40-repeat-containing domain protein [Suillus bovinus]